jgi:hypothetical protein
MNKELVIEDIHLQIVMSRTKSVNLRIQVTKDNTLLVKAPTGMPEQEIEHFIEQKQFWIYKQAKKFQDCGPELAEQEALRSLPLDERKKMAYDLMKRKMDFYCPIIGVNYETLRITTAKSYWGCCTKSRGLISFIWQMILLPEEIVDYIVVHELCHMIEANHSKAFWSKVGEYMPDYKVRREWLKENGWKYQ